jgi:hypothetical protein
LDDAVSAFGIHGMAGCWGILAPAFFASKYCQNSGDDAVVGLFYGGGDGFGALLKWQVIGVVSVFAWSFFGIYTWLFLLDKIMPLRTDSLGELFGPTKEKELMESEFFRIHFQKMKEENGPLNDAERDALERELAKAFHDNQGGGEIFGVPGSNHTHEESFLKAVPAPKLKRGDSMMNERKNRGEKKTAVPKGMKPEAVTVEETPNEF